MASSIWTGKRKDSPEKRPDEGRRGDHPRAGQAAEERQRVREEIERSLQRAMQREEREAAELDESARRFAFTAEIDLTELDSRFRPGLSWAGRAVEIGRSHLAFRSRRMCYDERRILVAVHLVDAMPVALYGEVVGCEYDGEGLYRTELTLMLVPELDVISDWIAARAARGAM